MFRTIACCSVPMLLLVLFAATPTQQPMPRAVQTVHLSGPHYDTVDYFNLHGKRLRWYGFERPDSNIVITYGDDSMSFFTAINSRKVIDLPSIGVITNMRRAYSMAANRDSVREYLFIVGRHGAVSEIVEGTMIEVNSNVKEKAGATLFYASKMQPGRMTQDIPSYTVHTHWRVPRKNDILYGSCPSREDTEGKQFLDSSRVSIILGWEPDKSYGPLTCQYEAKERVDIRKKYVSRICFYDYTGVIEKMDWIDFRDLITKIEQGY